MTACNFREQFAQDFRVARRTVMQPAGNFQSFFRNNFFNNSGCDRLLRFPRMKRFQLDMLGAHQQRPDAANIPRMFRTHAQPHRHAQADILDERAEFGRRPACVVKNHHGELCLHEPI